MNKKLRALSKQNGGMSMPLKTLGLQRINLDFISKNTQTFYSSNADKAGRGLEVHVLNGSAPFDCTGYNLTLYVKDGAEIYKKESSTIGGPSGIYEVLFPEGLAGSNMTGEIILSDGDEAIGSFQFKIENTNSLISNGELSQIPGVGILYTIIQAEAERVAFYNAYKVIEEYDPG